MGRTPFYPPLPDILAVKEDRQELAGAKAPGGPSPCEVLSVYLQGGPHYRLDRHTYRITPPVALLIPRGTLDCDLQTGRIEGSFVLFHGHGLLRKARGRPQRAVLSLGNQRYDAPFLIHPRAAEAERLVAIFHEIADVRSAGIAGQLRGVALLFQALAEYCAAATPRDKTGIHREVWRLRELLDAHPCENQGLDTLYQELNISAAHAEKLFKAAFHITPVAYRLQFRLRKARELLVASAMNVRQVSKAVGFSDPLYFSRLFRTTFGQAPSDLIRDFDQRRRGAPPAFQPDSAKLKP